MQGLHNSDALSGFEMLFKVPFTSNSLMQLRFACRARREKTLIHTCCCVMMLRQRAAKIAVVCLWVMKPDLRRSNVGDLCTNVGEEKWVVDSKVLIPKLP